MKKFTFAALFMAILFGATTMFADRAGSGTRIDYLNSKGERFWSTTVNADAINAMYFSVYGDSVNGYAVNCSQTVDENSTVKSLRFVPWGTESYPTQWLNENPDEIGLSYEVLPAGGPVRKKTVTRSENDEILCGSAIRIWIRVPEDAYPVIGFLNEYSQVSAYGDEFWYDTHAMPLATMARTWYTNSRVATDMSAREARLKELDGTGSFVRCEDQPGLWYYDTVMGNEPMSFRVSMERPDSEMLRQSVLMALAELYTQFQDFTSSPHTSSEGYIQTMCGDYMSQDMVSGLALSNQDYARYFTGMNMLVHANYLLPAIPWASNFAVITHANLILSQIDRFTAATQDERDQARAQMLALRSHAYFRLLQFYGSRWSESDGGSRPCAPLETEFKAENSPLATMREIADRCYADLDEALEIMQRTGFVRTQLVQPDIDVVRGIKLRVAMLREDWQTVNALADAILAEKPLTSNEQLTGGFFAPTDSWIWGVWNNTRISEDYVHSLYYWSFQSFAACNGSYPGVWSVGANAIDRDLFLSIPENDVRRSLFVMPESHPKLLRLADCYDGKYVDPVTLFFTDNKANLIRRYYENNVPAGVESPAFTVVGSGYSSRVPVPFGAQVKFYQPGSDQHNDAAMVLMRSEEVLLSQAEACARLGDTAKACELLTRLNGMRGEGYSCSATGDDLLAEIRKTRKIELWGEGHSWFDQKRWNMPMNRRMWESGNTESGNWPSDTPVYVATDFANGWRYPIPAYYLKQNSLVDISVMGYTDIDGYEETPQPSKPEAAMPAHESARSVEKLAPKPSDEFILRH